MRTMRNLLAKKAVVTVLAVGVSLAAVNAFWGGSDSALSQLGSSGSEVRAIQERLKERGLFNDSVTGYYGEKTKAAVIKFQKQQGISQTGTAGPQTLRALGISIGSVPSATEQNINLLARIISAEARGEPYVGQVAVGAVILNRIEHPSFPDTLSGVIYQNGAFTAVVDGQFNEPVAASAYNAARDALNGWDPTNGCVYYYNPAKTSNAINLPESGAVYVNGMDTLDENNLLPIREKVGMVFQNPDNQIVATIVEEDVAFALENMGVEPNEIRRRVDEALKTVGMYEYRLHAPHKLSGGQKQRVAIAGIIAMKPDCILLDEPTAMLDPHGRDEVMKTVKMLNEQGVTIVLITHYMEEAAQAQRVVVIDGGEVIMDNVPKKIFSNVETMKNLGLDVPQVTELCWELKRAGYDISTEIIHEDECVQKLYEMLK